jgi:8-oxo-dGTP diphosphatase
VRDNVLQTPLWQRAKEPDAGALVPPGGYLDPAETLEESIRRHLPAKLDLRELSDLEQLATWSDPQRDPRDRQLATGLTRHRM